jgi:hypothetical protein
MTSPLTQPGGYELFNTNEKISASDLNNMGLIALQSITSLLALLLFRKADGSYFQGFVAEDCKAIVSGALQVSIPQGMAILVDQSSTFTGFEPCVRLIVIPATVTQAITAHHATLARKDLVYLQAAYADADSTSDSLKDPSSGVVSTSTIYKRRKISYTVGYLAGTPHASPTLPATPTGALAICQVNVPATSGALTVTDRRERVQISKGVIPEPAEEYVSDYTSEGSEVAAGSGLAVTVQTGTHIIGGSRVRVNEVFTLGLATAHATLTRYDLVEIDHEGIATIKQGVAGAGIPVPTTDSYVAALIEIGPTETVPTSITDYRKFEPYATEQIQDAAITVDKAQQNRIQGLFAKAKAVPDMTIQTTEGLVDVAGIQAFHEGLSTAVTVTAAGVGQEKVGILQVNNAGAVSVKYGTSVAAGAGTAAYPAADADNIVLARIGTPASPIGNATTAIPQSMIVQTTARSWF